jgi:hypothetical protein
VGRLLSGAVLAWIAGNAWATDWHLSVDARLIASDGRESFLDSGLGALRYDSGHSGLGLGRARFEVSQPAGDILHLKLDASAWGDDDKNPLDLTEAYLELRPYPRAGYRARVRAGAFYAPVSLENRAGGWETPYTLSASALNTWIGEELRTIGLESQLEWLGTRLGHDFDMGLTAGVFGWNDPAGVLVAGHGFALHDRHTTLFGRVGEPGVMPVPGRELFHEIDGRAGIYYGAEGRYLDRLTLRALHYDNRADPTRYDAALGDFAWQTQFDSAGVRMETQQGWTTVVQWLAGQTAIEPNGRTLVWKFKTRFALLSRKMGQHTVSVRFDDFDVDSRTRTQSGEQDGQAWTAAYLFEPNERWRFALEGLQVKSEALNRALFRSEAPLATESKLELAVRYTFGAN